MKQCTTHSELELSASILNTSKTWKLYSERGNKWGSFGSRLSWRRWWVLWSVHFRICRALDFVTEISNLQTYFWWLMDILKLLTSVSQKTSSSQKMTVEMQQQRQSEELLNIFRPSSGKLTLSMATPDLQNITSTKVMFSLLVFFFINWLWWKMLQALTKRAKNTMEKSLWQLVLLGLEKDMVGIFVTFYIICCNFMKKIDHLVLSYIE